MKPKALTTQKGTTMFDVTIFAKKRTTAEGKKFYTYLSTLTRKDGTTVTTSVKFSEESGNPNPNDCPINITLDKKDANFSSKRLILDDGREVESNTLWVKAWKKSATPYVDNSMDDFE